MTASNPTVVPGAVAGEVGVAYTYTYTVNPGTFGPPYTFGISTGTLPAGLTLNTSTGTISGTPTTAGTSSFTVSCYANSNPSGIGYTNDSIVINAQPPVTKRLQFEVQMTGADEDAH